MFEEYSDTQNNRFSLDSSMVAGGAPEPARDNTADKYIPQVELIDSVAMADDFHKFLDAELQGEAEKPKIEDKYDLANIDKAVEAAIAHGKPIVMHAGAEWCAPCKVMEKDVWPSIEKNNKGNAIFLHIDGDKVFDEGKGGPHAKELMKGVEGYPTVRIVKPEKGPDGKITLTTMASNQVENGKQPDVKGQMDLKQTQAMLDKYFESQRKVKR
jgi:thiol:disulfide interchange protein